MFGWEFPPYNSGGLGTACYGLTKGLSHNNADVTFVLPTKYNAKADFVKIISADDGKLKMIKVDSNLVAYMSAREYELSLGKKSERDSIYGNDIFEDCQFYNQETKELRTLEEQLKLNTQQEIEEFCIKCGRCCYYWENGRRIHACSQLKVVEVPDGKFSLPVVG